MKKAFFILLMIGFIINLFSSDLFAQFPPLESPQAYKTRVENSLHDPHRYERVLWQQQQQQLQWHLYQQQQLQANQSQQQRTVNNSHILNQVEQQKQRQLQQANPGKKAQKEEKKRRDQEHLKKQEILIKNALENWDEVMKESVSVYIKTVQTDKRKDLLEDGYLTSIIECANNITQAHEQIENELDFAVKMRLFWEAKSEEQGSFQEKRERANYRLCATKIEGILEKKAIEVRTWTSGKNTVEATLIAIAEDEKTIKLRRKDNSREISVPLEKLSETDQLYVRTKINNTK